MPTPEEAAKLAGEKSADQLVKEAKEYADPRMVDEEEAKAAYDALGIKKPTAADVKKLMGQYEETGLTDKAKANLDNARYNSIIAQLDDLTVGASQETLDAIALVKSDLAKQVTDLGFKIDKTAGDLTGAVDTAKTELRDEIAGASTDVRAVADLVGKPASEVTQGDIDYVKQFLSGGGNGQADLTYDYNGDGVVDINDQTALEGIVGSTGDGPAFSPATNSKWAATGVYSTLEANDAAAQKAMLAKPKEPDKQTPT